MADLKNLQGVSEKDRKLIADAEALLGPEPSQMGFIKNLFWGNFREELVFPYPTISDEEKAACEKLLGELGQYLETDHPSVKIDQDQEIPQWVIDKLFDLGVLGMTIPKEFGGRGLGITSYNRVLERIGRSCGSTAVLVSAHQSIGCKAIMLFGTDEQKRRWLPHLAKDWLSAFCLSEPNVGCDAGGQETVCHLSSDGTHYILNGEKKWATSAALSQVFTVMAKQQFPDGGEKVTALVCTPDIPGIDIFQKNRSKMSIRGTWQARIRFTNAKVPRENLLHKEGKGLNVALSCLNYGRCTLSAGMLGGAVHAYEQSVKWGQYRFQFQRPLADFELVRKRIAHMATMCYAMDAVLYMTTGMLDRHDEDIMLETAACKVFCSEMGWRVVNDAIQIMGGEGFMTEAEVERVFRDSRINTVVEGANEVMQSFIFAYGGKQLAEKMLGVQEAVGWHKDESLGANLSRIFSNLFCPGVFRAAWPLGTELFLGIKPAASEVTRLDPSLSGSARRLCGLARDLSHEFKVASKRYEEKIVTRQAVQARLADAALWLHAWACTLSKHDRDIRAGLRGEQYEADRALVAHLADLAESSIRAAYRELHDNCDDSMLAAADVAIRAVSKLPDASYVLPESSPAIKASAGRTRPQDGIRQFPGDMHKAPPQTHETPQTEPARLVAASVSDA
ncbi:MAG: acyl-CoA dehydrogenase family protein [Tepidisphaeraceae bacterium]